MSSQMMSPNGKHPEETPENVGFDEAAQVGAFLHRWRDPAPDPAAKAQLLSLLAAEMEAQQVLTPPAHRVEAQPVLKSPRPMERGFRGEVNRVAWAGLILRAQVQLVHPATWAASALVIALGALVTLILYRPAQSGAELPLVIIAPLVAACGVAFLYGLETDPALELQLATPVAPRVILLGRLALLFGFNLLITLVCSVGLALTQTGISLAPLIAAWLAPMTFLSALAFLLSVIFFDSLASVLISLLLWVGAAARHFVSLEPFFLPDMLQISYQPIMLMAAAPLVLLALWLAEREERFPGGAD